MKSFILAICMIVGVGGSTHAALTGEDFFYQPAPQHIFINNRILATVNGKSISVIDVMKKMDLLFYKQFPQYTSSIEARFQFYYVNWKKILNDLIDKELVLADAKEKKVEVTSGDIRQEMESSFGPNIIINLDKVGLTFQEAKQMVQDDLTLRRMIGYRVNFKAIKEATPANIRAKYELFAKENRSPEMWVYTVVTVRDPDSIQGANAANLAHKLLTEQKVDLLDLPLKIQSSLAPSTKITLSETFKHQESELSPAYREALSTLTAGNYSFPLAQESRAQKGTVFRIFFFKEKIPSGVPAFEEVAKSLKEEILDQAIDRETEAYLEHLRKHYHVQDNYLHELVDHSFEPFVLR